MKIKIGESWGTASRRATCAAWRTARAVIGDDDRAVRRRQRRLHAQAGDPGHGGAADLDVALVRGAGLLRRPRRPARGPRRGRRRRDRRGVRLRPLLLPPDVRGRRRRLPAGRRHALRRHHRVAARRRGRGVVRPGGLGALRARTCTSTPPPRSPTCATSSGSTTTSASSRCSSTARSTRSAARSPRIRRHPATG